MRALIYILLLLPFSIIAQNLNCSAKANKTDLLVGEPAQINVSFNIPANEKIDTVYFKLAGNNDTLGNNWELWNSENITKKSFQDSENNYFIQYSKQWGSGSTSTRDIPFI